MSETKASLGTSSDQMNFGLVDSSQPQPASRKETTKESKKRIHPYNIPRGTATWSGPYGKDGTIRLDDVPADVVAHPVYKNAHGGAVTFMVEVESPPELKGRRFQVAKPLKREGWIR